MKKSFLLSILFIVLAAPVWAQQTEDKAQLEKERQEIQKEIREIQGMYDKVKGQKKETLGQLNLIQRKVNLQNRYINNINKELRYISDDIYRSNVEVFRLQKQLDTLKAQYARSIVYAYKNKSTYDFLNFIFSAGSFNDAVKRIGYLKSYRIYREEQVNNIIETQKLIEQRKMDQIGKKKNKDEALKNQTVQAKILDEQKKEQSDVVSKLKSKEKELQKQLADKRKRDQNLKNAIAAIVRREIDAAEAAKKKRADEDAKKNPSSANPVTVAPGTPAKTVLKNDPVIFNSEADLRLSGNFEANRGRLPWPVDQGFVGTHFGPYEYMIDGNKKPLTGINPGITITTPSPGSAVKVVFDGEVVGVFNIADFKVVTVRHGKYFTSYSNLSSVSVTKGTMVKTGQVIGKAAQADDGTGGGQIDFLLMIEKKEVNPEGWLRK